MTPLDDVDFLPLTDAERTPTPLWMRMAIVVVVSGEAALIWAVMTALGG